MHPAPNLQIHRDSSEPHPLTVVRSDATSTRNDANGRHVDSAVDIRRASALATAVESLLAGGLTDQARPLAQELAMLLREAAAADTPLVLSLEAERLRRGR